MRLDDPAMTAGMDRRRDAVLADRRRFRGMLVAHARRRRLERGGQVEPELERVELLVADRPAAMHDAAARAGPFDVARAGDARVAQTVLERIAPG